MANVDARALVTGRKGLVHDLVVHFLAACGVQLVDPRRPLPPGGPLVVVLVDPEPGHWQLAKSSGTPFVVITHDDVDDDAVVDAVVRGAEALLHTDTAPESIVDAITTVASGGTLLTPTQARALAQNTRTRPQPEAVAGVRLTGREVDILRSIDRGESVKQTARALGISVKTVENLQSRLFRKLEARNRAQAVAIAHARNLLDDTETVGSLPHDDSAAGGGHALLALDSLILNIEV